MNLLPSLFAADTGRSGIASPEDWLIASIGVEPSTSGMSITPETAAQVTAVWACWRILGGAFGSLPGHVYQRTEGGKRRADEHSLEPIVHDEPNEEQDSFTWREMQMVSDLAHGNAYSYISMPNGRVEGLWPQLPQYVWPHRNQSTGELLYDLTLQDGHIETMSRWNMLHVPGLGFDGIVGRSPLTCAREAIGLALVTEKHGASFFGQGARPSVALETDQKANRQVEKNLQRMWIENHGGPSNMQRPAVLMGGVKLKDYGSISYEDLQFLQTRGFQIAEIARLYGVPLWLLAEISGSTSWGSGIESMGIGFVVYTLAPWLRRFERRMNRSLFTPKERAAGYYIEFNADGLLRGDFLQRMQGYQIAVGGPFMRPNEARRNENLDDVEGGDELLRNLNQTTGGTAGPTSKAAFRPLLEATWTRILKRGQQDGPAALKAGSPGDFWSGWGRYRDSQLAPVAVAMSVPLEALRIPAAALEHDPGAPESWNVAARAQQVAAATIGDN
jgi:HK97 family phage portal protein